MQAVKETNTRSVTLERLAQYAAYLYIGLPILIFLLGWIRWYIAVPMSLAVLFSFFLCWRDASRSPVHGSPVRKSTLAAFLLLICCWVFVSGIGGYVYQNPDHPYRNQIFRILVEHPWPPTKSVLTDSGLQVTFLSYYIGFWLPSALIGKLFGLGAGYAFQYIWAVLGISILFVQLSRLVKRWSIASALVFIFFSGLDVVGFVIRARNLLAPGLLAHLEWWSGYQFSSHTTQLFWVFNQAIYGWLLTAMILNETENRRLILIWSCGLLECTFPFVGMIPFLAWRIIRNVSWKDAGFRRIQKWSAGFFSVENILGGGIIGIVSFLYLFGNKASLSPGSPLTITSTNALLRYVLFILLEVVVYFLAVSRSFRKQPLFWISLVTLLLCPLFRVGTSMDFCMRASIPALMVLCLMVTETLQASRTESRRRFLAILALLLIGAITPMHEIGRTVVYTCRGYSAGEAPIQYVPEDEIFNGINFSASVNDSLFAKYLSRENQEERVSVEEDTVSSIDAPTDNAAASPAAEAGAPVEAAP